MDTINRVAKAKARHTEDLEEVVCRRMWQKLGLLVQKGNCALFDNRVQPGTTKTTSKYNLKPFL